MGFIIKTDIIRKIHLYWFVPCPKSSTAAAAYIFCVSNYDIFLSLVLDRAMYAIIIASWNNIQIEIPGIFGFYSNIKCDMYVLDIYIFGEWIGWRARHMNFHTDLFVQWFYFTFWMDEIQYSICVQNEYWNVWQNSLIDRYGLHYHSIHWMKFGQSKYMHRLTYWSILSSN